MKPTWTYMLGLGLTLTFAVGCQTSGKIRSVRDESYTGKLERVLVVFQGKAAVRSEDTTATLGRNFQQRVAARLAESLTSRNIPSEVVGTEESAIDRFAPVKTAVARFEPKQMLYANVTQISSSSTVHWVDVDHLPIYTHNVVIKLEFEVRDVASDKTVWRGAVSFQSAPLVETVVVRVLSELGKARLL